VKRSRDGRSQTSHRNGGPPRGGRARQRAFLIAALPENSDGVLDELRELLRTAGVASVGEIVQQREQPHPNTYLGPGKLEELKTELASSDATSSPATTSSPPARSGISNRRWAYQSSTAPP
jgi:GTP-binding protein HflX